MEGNKTKPVYVITERAGKTFWTRIGIAYVNRDGSLNIRLDAIPVDGALHVRDWSPRDEQSERPKRSNGKNTADDLPEGF